VSFLWHKNVSRLDLSEGGRVGSDVLAGPPECFAVYSERLRSINAGYMYTPLRW
jgi:hypothetical protein